MNKIFLLFALVIGVISCKNTEKDKTDRIDASLVNDKSVVQINTKDRHRGEFLFMQDAAVLKGENFIYGVTINEMSKELAQRVESIKVDEFTMVPVFVRGTVKDKPIGADGWDEILTITEIINVSLIPAKEDIKIEDKKS
jgi:hypothetical protein